LRRWAAAARRAAADSAVSLIPLDAGSAGAIKVRDQVSHTKKTTCRDRARINFFPFPMASAQAFDFVGFHLHQHRIPSAAARSKTTQKRHPTLFFRVFFAFCREATCTPYLVRA